MKRMNKFIGMGCALVAIALTSCSNELSENIKSQADGAIVNPIVKPDVVAWSGKQTFGNSFSTSASTRATSGSENGIQWEISRTTEIDYDSEVEFIESVLKEGEEFIPPVEIDKDFLFYAPTEMSFELYPIYLKTNQTHTFGIFYYDVQGTKHEMLLWDDENTFSPWGGTTETSYDQSGQPTTYIGRKITVPAGCKFGFFYNGIRNYDDSGNEYYFKTQQEECNFYTTSILNEYSYNNIPGYNPSEGQPTKYYVRAVQFYDDDINKTKTYLGLEDWVDFDYQDIVFYCPTVLNTVDSNNTTPGVPSEPEEEDPCPKKDEGHDCHHPGSTHNPDGTCPDCIKDNVEDSECYPESPEDYCPRCGHPNDGDNDHTPGEGPCKDCGTEGPCHKGTTGGSTGGNTEDNTDTVKPTGNEVEINLALQDVHTLPNGSPKYGIADLVTKLSMHVRYPHDIEVIIPVPAIYYCNQDDLYIFSTHYDEEMAYGGERIVYEIEEVVENNELIKEIKIHSVTLGVDFVPASQDNLTTEKGGYIRVYTDGITPALIDFLQKTYGDGINFEVYNYYNRGTMYTLSNADEISYNKLQYDYLSHSFVNFDWNETGTKVLPDNYINAFNTVGGQPNAGDCYNWIIGDAHANVDNFYKANGSINNNRTTNITWGNDQGERASYADPSQGYHYNGSALNWIYTLKSLKPKASTDMPAVTWPFNDTSDDPWQSIRFNGDNYFSCRPTTSN